VCVSACIVTRRERVGADVEKRYGHQCVVPTVEKRQIGIDHDQEIVYVQRGPRNGEERTDKHHRPDDACLKLHGLFLGGGVH